MDTMINSVMMHFHLWSVLLLIVVAMFVYAWDKLPIELVSLGIVTTLIALFHFAPLPLENGKNVNPSDFLLGLANPALIAVLGLLVLGQAVVNTGSLSIISQLIFKWFHHKRHIAVAAALFSALCVSSFINDTPTVVVFIPIILAIAKEMQLSASKVMIPLSYVAILGGTTTLIGSSTNLLVSGSVTSMGLDPLSMFAFTKPGVCIAVVGFLYIVFVLPRLLPDRAPLSSELIAEDSKEFVIQLEVPAQSDLIGKSVANNDDLLKIKNVTFKMLQRREHAYLPPFSDELSIKAFDVLVLTVTKDALYKLVTDPIYKSMFSRIAALNVSAQNDLTSERTDNLSIVEVLIAPASKMIGQTVEQIGFYHKYHCTVLGIQRRSRMITSSMTESRLAAGDVLMVMGTRSDIEAIRDNRDMMLMEWSRRELPSKKMARRANLIFGTVILFSALELLPVFFSAMLGAIACVLFGCLSPRQAVRAIDVQIIVLVAAGMAMSHGLEVTGGAEFLANQIISNMEGVNPVWIMSALFMLMAITTNVLSNNATALIFTPIAVTTALTLKVPPEMFIYAVVFASNCCSFASPIGFQTNLLVMGPGHYKFIDYIKGGVPLILLVWITYTLYCAINYGEGIAALIE
jgi:di/tricarboxylate transporter